MLRLPTSIRATSRALRFASLPKYSRHSRSFSEKAGEIQPTETHNGEIEDNTNVPWYLRNDVASPLNEKKEVEIPEIPSYAPAEVPTFCDLLVNKYGMTDLLFFNMTELDDTHEFRAGNSNVDYIIICSGKSEKHNFKAAGELRHYLKHTYDYVPRMEGMTNGAMSPVMRRRLLRRASRGPLATANDYGKSANSWIMCTHENIEIHIMTKERREDLNLESLWCKPEDADKYAPKEPEMYASDHIFSGIRRFHTSARALSSLEVLESQLYKLQNLDLETSDKELLSIIKTFEDAFVNPNFRDHQLRFQLYRSIHIIRPNLVSFEQVEDALLAKYASIDLALDTTSDHAAEKAKDVSQYARILLDSPELNSDRFEKNHANIRLQKLSEFIRLLYSFSNDTFSMTQDPEFIPLLWRLTYEDVGQPVTPHMVDQVLYYGEELKPQSPKPSVELASSKARDVLGLVSYHNEKIEPGSELTAAFQELVMFTYGNAGKWDAFWKEWNNICFSRISPSKEAVLQSWLRLIVYLSLVNNRSQILHLFNHHWDNGSAVGGTVMDALRANGEKFQSDSEKHALQNAVFTMLSSLGPGVFEGVRTYVAEL